MDESNRVNSANTRARKLGLEADLTLDQWIAILESYNYSCGYCGGHFEEIDHVRPLSEGGATTAGNVIPCCSKCNKRKGSTTWTTNPRQMIFTFTST